MMSSTSLEAGEANRRIPDEEVLGFAAAQMRVLLTLNRRDFLKLHYSGAVDHPGLVLCTADVDFAAQAAGLTKPCHTLERICGTLSSA